MAAMTDLQIPREKLNIHGGGCALGHPTGATGKNYVTLVSALKQYGLKRDCGVVWRGRGDRNGD